MIELGFQNSILIFVFLSGLITSFVIRWKWNKSVERKMEVMRLLAMAKEEAARVEIEAAVEYGSVYFVGRPSSQCAVCFSPTTTRCSRCKAVKYCSGRCQIVHWRQGHKDECYPAKNTFQYNGPDTDTDRRAASQGIRNEENFNSVEVEESGKDKVDDTYAKGVESSISNNSDHKVSSELGESPIIFDSISTSFVESPAVTVEEPSVDTILPDLPVSDTPVGLEKSVSKDMSQHVPDVRVNANDVNRNNSLSPKHEPFVDASPLDSVPNSRDGLEQPLFDDTAEGVIESKKDFDSSNLSKSPSSLFSTSDDSVDNTSQSESTSSSGSSFYGPYGSKVSYQSTRKSDFWGEALGSNEFEIDVYDDSTQSSLSEAGEDNLADSKSLTSESSQQGVSHFQEQLNPSIHLRETVSSGIVWKKSARRIPSSVPLVVDTSKSNSSPTIRSEKTISVKNTGRSTHLFGLGARSASINTSRDDKLSGVQRQSVSDINSSATAVVKTLPTGSSGSVNSMTNGGNGLKTSVKKVVQPLNVFKHPKHNSSGLGFESVEKSKYKMLFPYEKFVKLYHWKEVELHPCGLKNCGNSCYANVVLQCLTFTRPLAAYLLLRFHSKACPKKGWCFMCEFEGLILKMDGKSLLSPVNILSQLKSNGSHLGDGRQEDAHEFLRYVIDTMQSVCTIDTGGIGVAPPSAEETSLIGLIFGGYLQSRIRCMKCHFKSEKHERMMDLSVEIQGGIGTLEEALKQFTATEILDNENRYDCFRCRSYEKARKKLTILEAPNVLTIALKRFQSGQNGKINKPVKFPLVLDLCPYMSRTTKDRSPVYSLYAVVVHLDTNNATSSGHYVCYVKTIQGKWFNIDDSTVKPVDTDTVLSQKAYMLLYARISPRAPSSARAVKTVQNPINASMTSVPRERLEDYPYWTTLDPYNRRFVPMQQVDSSSDNSSLLSCSDEGSCSTESTRDSTSTDDFPEYIHTTDLYRVFESPPILDSNTSKNCRDLTNSKNSSSNNNDTDVERLGRGRVIDVNSGVPQRRISRDTNAVSKFY